MSNTLQQTTNNKLTIKFYPKCIIVCILFTALILLELFNNGSYLDEIIGIVSPVYLILSRKKIKRDDIITIIILAFVVLIGVISNALSDLGQSIFSICVDIIAETKLLFSYFAIKYFLSNDEKQATINMLVPVSKLYCIFAFVCSIISLFFDIGMSGEERYGIRSFRFIFDFNFQYVAVYMLVFGVIVCNTAMRKKQKNKYYVIAIISLLLATKAPPILFSIIFVLLLLYFKKHKQLSLGIILLGTALVVLAGWYQIDSYLLADNTPRHIFFEYGFKTANTYFPFGSGFATFGSDQASRHYSALYYQYGFDKQWGMSPDYGPFLSDTFWPMAIAQFGWIGAILYIYVYVRLFLSFTNKNTPYYKKAFLFAAFLQYMIHGIGSAILSSSAGMIGFMALAIFSTIDDSKLSDRRIKKVKIRF